jgi:hypothetical protein
VRGKRLGGEVSVEVRRRLRLRQQLFVASNEKSEDEQDYWIDKYVFNKIPSAIFFHN